MACSPLVRERCLRVTHEADLNVSKSIRACYRVGLFCLGGLDMWAHRYAFRKLISSGLDVLDLMIVDRKVVSLPPNLPL